MPPATDFWSWTVSHYQIIIRKSYLVIFKPAIEIKFRRQIIVLIKLYNIIRWYYIFYAWPTLWRH